MLRFIKKQIISGAFILLLGLPSLQAFDIWQYPLAADRDSIFAGVFAARFSFDFSDPSKSEFAFDHPKVYLDYVLPVGLPFSFGIATDSLRTDQYGLGFRLGYHVNFDVPDLNAYVLYSLDYDISRTRITIDHGPRIGMRYTLFNLVCLNIETGYRLQSLIFGLALKLH